MTENPYAPPGSDLPLAVQTPEGVAKKRIYSPTQVACGSALGGPVALIYFVKDNFDTLGNAPLARRTLQYGVIFLLAILILLLFLPENFPSLGLTVGYILIAKYATENYQITKQAILESDVYDFQSNWRVFSRGLFCLAGTVVAAVVLAFILEAVGFSAI